MAIRDSGKPPANLAFHGVCGNPGWSSTRSHQHDARGRLGGGERSRPTEISSGPTEPNLGGRGDGCADPRRDVVFSDHQGCVLAPHRGMVDQCATGFRVDGSSTAKSDLGTESSRRCHSSFRSRFAVYLHGVSGGLPSGEYHTVHGRSGKLLRQCHGREFLRGVGKGVDSPATAAALRDAVGSGIENL